MSEGARIRDFMLNATKEQASLVTRVLSLKTLAGVVLRTPVDTGRARGNWQVNLGNPSGREVDTEDKGGTTTISEGSQKIGQQKGYTQVVLENNLPYIDKLDSGSSKQAPQGMVAGTLASLGLSTGRS